MGKKFGGHNCFGFRCINLEDLLKYEIAICDIGLDLIRKVWFKYIELIELAKLHREGKLPYRRCLNKIETFFTFLGEAQWKATQAELSTKEVIQTYFRYSFCHSKVWHSFHRVQTFQCKCSITVVSPVAKWKKAQLLPFKETQPNFHSILLISLSQEFSCISPGYQEALEILSFTLCGNMEG